MNRSALCGPQIVNLKFIILHNLQLSDSNVHREQRMHFHLLPATDSDADADAASDSDSASDSDCESDSESYSAFVAAFATSAAFRQKSQSRFKV